MYERHIDKSLTIPPLKNLLCQAQRFRKLSLEIMMSEKKIRAKITGAESEFAYITLPGYPSDFGKTICLDNLIDGLKGPRINLDFNRDGVLIGIEILA